MPSSFITTAGDQKSSCWTLRSDSYLSGYRLFNRLGGHPEHSTVSIKNFTFFNREVRNREEERNTGSTKIIVHAA